MKNLWWRQFKENASSRLMLAAASLVIMGFFIIFLTIFSKSLPAISEYSVAELLFSSEWNPRRYSFGFYPAIVGTFYA
ncbi:MAG TPA: phosphate ABC transporter permease subunit PstC, partial [Candidatus Altiarchaeales archaeon]|nr:phosphate ABC transporter permease subunit PstC [Candidatus Altiarchaeales archaeon]